MCSHYAAFGIGMHVDMRIGRDMFIGGGIAVNEQCYEHSTDNHHLIGHPIQRHTLTHARTAGRTHATHRCTHARTRAHHALSGTVTSTREERARAATDHILARVGTDDMLFNDEAMLMVREVDSSSGMKIKTESPTASRVSNVSSNVPPSVASSSNDRAETASRGWSGAARSCPHCHQVR